MSRELERIRWLRAFTGGPSGARAGGRTFVGLGDDAAVWSPPAGHAAVLTVDVQVEGVHFRRGWLSAAQLGARAVSSAASDLAAMAARPGGILLALTLPPGAPDRTFRDIYRGASLEAGRLGLAVLGGNLSAGPLAVSVTAVGSVRPGQALLRGGARAGDCLYVTGWPGRSALGLALLMKSARGGPRSGRSAGPARAAAACLRAFRSPRARIAEAQFLARRCGARSMIDLSDGLTQDLGHLIEESRRPRSPLGARLDPPALAAILAEEGCAELARRLGRDPVQTALTGGEDYELLFTAPPGAPERRAGAFRRRFGLPLTRVGTVEARPGLRLEGGLRLAEGRLSLRGYEHW